MKRSLTWVLGILTAVPLATMAQTTETTTPRAGLFGGSQQFRTVSIGVNAGVLMPTVPIGGSNDFTKWQLNYGYGAYVKWQALRFLGFRANFTGGKVKGDNSRELGNGNPPNRQYQSFETTLKWSGSLNAEFDVANINWLHKKPFALLYMSIGGGLAGYNPEVTTPGGVTTDYKPSGSIKEFFVPVGAGVKFRLSEALNLDLGYTMHFVDGDNFDGYNYNSPTKDKFSYAYVGLEFPLGSRSKPQLVWHNAPAVMYDDMVAQRDRLQAELAAQKEANAKVTGEMARLTADSDGDGVSDFFDKCPNTPQSEKVDGSGCPLPKDTVKPAPVKVIITEDDRRLVRDAIANLEFATGKSDIKPSSYASLDRVADLLIRKNLSLKLAGHTDNVGNDANNMRLSKDRAESVKAYLVGKGANPSRIEATGYGETQPIASNKTAAGRQKNRRVEFTLF
ncbi:OmpA family protein [Chitinophaga lutea]